MFSNLPLNLEQWSFTSTNTPTLVLQLLQLNTIAPTLTSSSIHSPLHKHSPVLISSPLLQLQCCSCLSVYTHCFMLEDHLGSVIRLIIIIIVIGSYIYPAIYQTMHHQVVFTLIIHDTFRKYICQVHNTVKGRGPKPLSC